MYCQKYKELTSGYLLCWPVLVPQITGEEDPPATETANESSSHLPRARAGSPPALAKPNKVFATVTVVKVDGPEI